MPLPKLTFGYCYSVAVCMFLAHGCKCRAIGKPVRQWRVRPVRATN